MASCVQIPKKPSRELYCQHCHQTVTKSTFYRHRSKYYDPISDVWRNDPAAEEAQGIVDEDHQDCSDDDMLMEVEAESRMASSPSGGSYSTSKLGLLITVEVK